MPMIDLDRQTVRELNAALHRLAPDTNETLWEVTNSDGKHAIGAGVDAPIEIHIKGHVGYYCAGMNKQASICIHGNAGTGVAENMMSGVVHVMGDASQSAGATGHGGLLIVDGDAAARCGISMKGIDIIVKGSIGAMSAFMAQAGNLVVLGDAGEALGDSIYEATIFVRGKVRSLGADCIEKPMAKEDRARLAELLRRAGVEDGDLDEFRMYGSARRLYNFHIDNIASY
ncbi:MULTISPECIES: protein glxC [Bradyrhizobium]|uniref:protein glxC n=1 Tax=Bradyrhizobium elkanii TaxID=29448 RepID=UPI000422F482|nr:protein glxC [Bradyrhizobium elkanii]